MDYEAVKDSIQVLDDTDGAFRISYTYNNGTFFYRIKVDAEGEYSLSSRQWEDFYDTVNNNTILSIRNRDGYV